MSCLFMLMLLAFGCSDTQMLLTVPDAGGDAALVRDATPPDRDASEPDAAVGDAGPPPDATLPPVPIAPPALLDTCVPGVRGRDIAVGPDGTIVAVGSFRGSTTIGDDELVAVEFNDGIVVALTADGTPLWTAPVGGTGNELMRGVDITSGGDIVVAGQFQSDIDVLGTPFSSAGAYDGLLASFTTTGALSWAQRFGGPDGDFAVDVEVTDTHIVVAGTYTGDLPLAVEPPPILALGTDTFAARLDHAGASISARGLGGGGADFAMAIAVTPDDRTALVGQVSEVIRDSAGEIAVRNHRGFAAAWDELGSEQDFLETYALNAAVRTVAATPDGELVIAGSFEAYGDLGVGPLAGGAERGIFIARLTMSGTLLWARGFAGSNAKAGHVSVTDDGTIVVTGTFGSIDFGAGPLPRTASWGDAFVAWLSPEGEILTAYPVESETGSDVAPHAISDDGTLWLGIDQMLTVEPDRSCSGLRIVALPPPR